MLDIDDLLLPSGVDIQATPEEAVLWVLRNRLPPEFANATVVCQWSNSAALTASPDHFKGHLWFWTSRPYSSAEMKAWGKWWNSAHGGTIDTSVFVEMQPHYTAGPTLKGIKSHSMAGGPF